MARQRPQRTRSQRKSQAPKRSWRDYIDLAVNKYPAWSLFFLALLVRMVYLAVLTTKPGFGLPIVDEIEYDRMARLFSTTLTFEPGPLFRPPLWPMLLGFMYIIFGPTFPIARLVNTLLGALAVAAAYRLGVRLFDKKIAFISGILLSFYGLLVHYNTGGLATSLTIYLSLEALIISLKAYKKQSNRWIIFAGVLWGLAALARPVALLSAGVIGLFMLMVRPGEAALSGPKRLLMLIIGILVAVLPITIRNALEGDPTLISTNGGINLYLGNNEKSVGFTAFHPELGVWWTPVTAHRWAERQKGEQMSPSEVSSWYAKEAVRFMMFQPEKAIKLLLKKTYLSFNRLEIGNNGDISFFARNNALLYILMLIGFGTIIPFGILGAILAFRRSTEIRVAILVAFTHFFVSIIFFVAARFRIPAIPILLPFAVFAGFELFKALSRKSIQHKASLVGGLVVVGFLVNSNLLGMARGDTAYGYFLHGQILAREQKWDEAIEAFEKTLELGDHIPLANYYLAHIYLKLGEPELVIEYANREIDIYPNKMAFMDLGKAHRLLGEREKAEEAFMRAYQIEPNDPEIRGLLAQETGERAISAADSGNWGTARDLFMQAGNLDPQNPFFPFAIAGANWALGDTLIANQLIEGVLFRYPDFEPALEWQEGWRPSRAGETPQLLPPEKPDYLPGD
ncbi:glycosyltransferase family 39 protein [bacterium]|nr:glycosyltransferase family 39 protein [bacterium]